jgi:WhiB family redox-sensing transcriptional regulator
MFPEPGDKIGEREAKAVCKECPVRRECLIAALTERHPDGIWGGFTTRERQRILKLDLKNPAALFQFVSRGSSAGR